MFKAGLNILFTLNSSVSPLCLRSSVKRECERQCDRLATAIAATGERSLGAPCVGTLHFAWNANANANMNTNVSARRCKAFVLAIDH